MTGHCWHLLASLVVWYWAYSVVNLDSDSSFFYHKCLFFAFGLRFIFTPRCASVSLFVRLCSLIFLPIASAPPQRSWLDTRQSQLNTGQNSRWQLLYNTCIYRHMWILTYLCQTCLCFTFVLYSALEQQPWGYEPLSDLHSLVVL